MNNDNANSGQSTLNDNHNIHDEDVMNTNLSSPDIANVKTARLADHSAENKLPAPDKVSQYVSATRWTLRVVRRATSGQ